MLRFKLTRSFVVVAACGLLGLALTAPAIADNKNNNKNSAQEKKDDARVKAEQQDLQKAKQDAEREEQHLRAAQKDLAEAQAKVKAAGRAEQEARESIEAKQERVVGIDKALAKQEDAKKAYELAAQPVIATLKDSPTYKTIKARAEAAHEELKKIRSNSDLSYEERRRLEAAASQRALAASDAERTALNANPTVKPLKEKLDAAQEVVAELRAKIKAVVDADPSVKSAHQHTEKAREVVEAAQAKVNQASQKAGAARAKYAKEAGDVSRAVAADRANDNKGKSNNKGKKK